MRRDWLDIGSGNTFNAWWSLDIAWGLKPIEREWPKWLTPPAHYAHIDVKETDSFQCIIQSEYILIPSIPGYSIVRQGDNFVYVKK